ncbi:MAG: DUF4416 family protein [Calditrichaeota bacterium]|nr:MAG: DUF4416 family protein [Calditrichota bacterium]
MGDIHLPKKVCLICAVCYQQDYDRDAVFTELQQQYGTILNVSDVLHFNHTTYYAEEMGEDLKKVFISFAQWINADELAAIKIFTNAIEQNHCENGKRRINIDPGYIELPKLVLASTKNFSHRIYIGRGIYGDVQLCWRQGGFQSNPWTYDDYKDEIVVTFFESIRKEYHQQLQRIT